MRHYIIRQYYRLKKIILESLQAGLTPHRMALAFALSVLWGTMPMLGPVTGLSLISSWAFRLSIPLVVGLTYLMTPLQVILAVPFQQLGAWWFPVTTQIASHNAGMVPWLEKAGTWQIQALEAWIIVMLPVAGFIYLIVFVVLRHRRKKSLEV